MATRSMKKRVKPLRSSQSQLPYDQLESKNLLAGISFDAQSGVITVDGRGARDAVHVTQSGNQLKVTMNEVGAPTFDFGTVNEIVFYGYGGDDWFRNDTGVPVNAYGHAGDDVLIGGTAGDLLRGGVGEDRIVGNSGDDFINGDSGRDLIFGGFGNDRIFGADGDDLIKGQDGNDFVGAGNGHDYIQGGSGNDRLFGDSDDDTLVGGPGDDYLAGSSGDDTLNGNLGRDKIFGNEGRDRLFGGPGEDQLHGGGDNDVVIGHASADRLFGNDGNDWLSGGEEADVIYGGNGNDRALGEGGNDSIFGQSGHDFVSGGSGSDSLHGNDGWDRLDGGSGRDVVKGHDGNDQIDGGTGDDSLYGFAGDDVIRGGDGHDDAYGGSGRDSIFGGSGLDRLFGEDGDDDLRGDDDNDDLNGGNGADTLVGGNGNDDFESDSDDDIFDDAEDLSPDGDFEIEGVISNLDTANSTFELNGIVVDYSISVLVGNPVLEGNYVEAEGRYENGTLSAYKIENDLPDDNGENFKATGPIANLNTTNQTFTMFDFTIDYSNAELETGLAGAAMVSVEGRLSGNTVAAFEIESGNANGDGDSDGDNDGDNDQDGSIELRASVENLDLQSKSFSLLGFTVDYSNAIFPTSLGNGDFVKVDGLFDGSGIVANEVELELDDNRDENIELQGQVTNLDSQDATFVVWGITVDYQHADVESGFANGDRVVVEGLFQNGELLAADIEAA